MGIKLSESFILALLAACSACGSVAAQNEVTDRAEVEGYPLSLVNKDGRCALEYHANGVIRSIELVPQPPCHFLRGESNEPQTYAYAGVAVSATLIVAGSPIAETARAEWNLDAQDVCGEDAQGVLLSDRGVTVTEKTLSGGVFCRDFGVDEKDYWFFAH